MEKIVQEKERILAKKDSKVIFQLLRKNIEVMNRVTLIEKALEF